MAARRDNSLLRVLACGAILAAFWGALLTEYWPDLITAGLRLVNATRAVGAETLSSRYFDARNNSNASESQARAAVNRLEKAFEAITAYTHTTPTIRPRILMVNGSGPAMAEGDELVINYDNGRFDLDLAPVFLVLLAEDIPVDLAGPLAPAGGHALQVVEAAGLGKSLIRQPLDSWVALLRQRQAYLPLEEAWQIGMPSDTESGYQVMRAMLESGSFMQWVTARYGREAAKRLAGGETVEAVTGQPLAANEAEWLRALDGRKLSPQACERVVPESSFFRFLCSKMREKP